MYVWCCITLSRCFSACAVSADRDQCQENENEKTSTSAIFSWNCLLVFIERSVFLSRKRNCWSATKCFRLTKKIVFVSRCYLVQQTIHPHNNEVTHYFGSQKQESLNSISLKQLVYVWLQCCVSSLLCQLLWKFEIGRWQNLTSADSRGPLKQAGMSVNLWSI